VYSDAKAQHEQRMAQINSSIASVQQEVQQLSDDLRGACNPHAGSLQQQLHVTAHAAQDTAFRAAGSHLLRHAVASPRHASRTPCTAGAHHLPAHRLRTVMLRAGASDQQTVLQQQLKQLQDKKQELERLQAVSEPERLCVPACARCCCCCAGCCLHCHRCCWRCC
jgi:hypothetical protein